MSGEVVVTLTPQEAAAINSALRQQIARREILGLDQPRLREIVKVVSDALASAAAEANSPRVIPNHPDFPQVPVEEISLGESILLADTAPEATGDIVEVSL